MKQKLIHYRTGTIWYDIFSNEELEKLLKQGWIIKSYHSAGVDNALFVTVLLEKE